MIEEDSFNVTLKNLEDKISRFHNNNSLKFSFLTKSNFKSPLFYSTCIFLVVFIILFVIRPVFIKYQYQ